MFPYNCLNVLFVHTCLDCVLKPGQFGRFAAKTEQCTETGLHRGEIEMFLYLRSVRLD